MKFSTLIRVRVKVGLGLTRGIISGRAHGKKMLESLVYKIPYRRARALGRVREQRYLAYNGKSCLDQLNKY